MNNDNSITCYKCNKNNEVPTHYRISRKEECNHCSASLYCCKMCIHYDVNHYNECKEINAERVLDKGKMNYCDYFSIYQGNDSKSSNNDDLLSAATALFKS